MQKFLQSQLLNNTIQSYLIVLGTVLIAVILKKYISKYLAGLIFRMLARVRKNTHKKEFFDLVVQPLSVFLVLIVSFVALDRLYFPEALDFKVFKASFKTIVDSISNGILISIFIWLCLRLIDFIAVVIKDNADLSKEVTENQLLVFFKDFFKAILVLMGILLILQFSFHKNIGNLLTSLSLVGAAVALATKESLENLIASLIIFFDKPFSTGETVKVHNFTGTIEKIGLRSTRIRTESKTYITVPNKQMVDSILDNISQRTQRRVDIKLNLDLVTLTQEIQMLLLTIEQSLSKESVIESSSVYLSETGKNAHIVTIEYYTSPEQSIEAFIALKQKINFIVIDTMNNLQISFADNRSDFIYNKPSSE
jgi:MscS family membrane protein